MPQKKIIKSVLLLVSLVTSIIFSCVSYAAVTVPLRFMYEGRLLDSTGTNPINTNHDFRFSMWKASAVQAGDVSGGSINTGAANYGGWQEVQTTTPNSDGFFSFELLSVVPLTTIDHTKHLYLQVEVKPAGAPDTAYEVLDRDPSDPSEDRAAIGSVPYAYNADKIDNREIGNSAGDIVVLDTGDVWPVSTIPGGTDQDGFILDNNDDAAGSINLQFGNTLSKILSWDLLNNYFNFNDDVNIQGDLTITGTVDGVDVSALEATVNTHLDGGASKHDASEIDIEASDGHYYFAGDLETAIDDLDQAVYDLVSGSKKIVISSEYDGVSYKPDGSENKGRLYIDNDSANGRNFYVWKSTPANLQDYDVIIQAPVPLNFTGWDGSTPWTFNYRSQTANSSDNKADIFVYDTANNPVTLTGTSTNLASTSWAATSLGFSGTPTFTPGDTFLIVVRMHSKNSNEMHMGEISLDYK